MASPKQHCSDLCWCSVSVYSDLCWCSVSAYKINGSNTRIQDDVSDWRRHWLLHPEKKLLTARLTGNLIILITTESGSMYEIWDVEVQSEAIASLEIRQTNPRLKSTSLNLHHKLFEKVAYIKSIPFERAISSRSDNGNGERRAEPKNTSTTGIATNHSTMFTLLLELNVTCGQRWIQFELQNCLSRAFAIDGKITLPFS